MTTVQYGESSIAVDICSRCQGIWLDEGEYREIVRYLGDVVDSSTVGDYLQDMREEIVQLLEAREGPLRVLKDLGKILYLLELRFAVDHPNLAATAQALPKF